MKFDIARQPLVPAFLTLAVFAVTAMCCADGIAAGALSGPNPAAAYGLPGWNTSAAADLYARCTESIAAGRLAIPLPGQLLVRFQAAFPVWSRIIAGFLILYAGMCTGRLTVRYNLYGVGGCLAIPLFAFIACPAGTAGAFLPAFAASALLALVAKHFSRSFCNGYAFDALFRASFYLGLLPLITPAALPLLLLMPLSLLLFRRTVREAVVATAGLLLPALACCYINWGAGGTFWAPAAAVGSTLLSGSFFALFATLPNPLLALIAGMAGLVLLAGTFFLTDLFAAGTKSRFVLIFHLCMWALTVCILFGPGATRDDLVLQAVPSAVLLPLLFVRMRRLPALFLYLMLLVAALLITILQ